jgi:hypothetical protein
MSSGASYATARTTMSPLSASPRAPARTAPETSSASAAALLPSTVTEWPPAKARAPMPRAMLPVPMIVMSVCVVLSLIR